MVDFSELQSDTGLYLLTGQLYYYFYSDIGQDTINVDEYFRIVWTRNISNEVKGYIDGLLQFTYDDNSLGSSMCSSNSMYLFRDDGSGNESPSGAVSQVTIYDRALTPLEVRVLQFGDVIYKNDFESVMLH